jgi:hypothetical protein
MADLWRDFWIGETGTGQQVAQLHDRYMVMMDFVIRTYEGYEICLRCLKKKACYSFTKTLSHYC